jgi:hypothetical protein
VERLMLDQPHLLPQSLLARAQRSLAPFALGDVDHVALRVHRSAFRVVDDHGCVVDPDDPAITRDEPVLRLERLPALVHGREVPEDSLAIVRVEDGGEEGRIGDPFVRRVADQVGDLRTHVDRALGVELLDVARER